MELINESINKSPDRLVPPVSVASLSLEVLKKKTFINDNISKQFNFSDNILFINKLIAALKMVNSLNELDEAL